VSIAELDSPYSADVLACLEHVHRPSSGLEDGRIHNNLEDGKARRSTTYDADALGRPIDCVAHDLNDGRVRAKSVRTELPEYLLDRNQRRGSVIL
jgi:hypothetical protein